MGCNGSKTSTPTEAAAQAKATLLNAPTQKLQVQDSNALPRSADTFFMFVDSVGLSGCLAAAATNIAFLQVEDVQGGPIGLWNNRPHTEKVKKGDFVMKVRKAGPIEAQWLAGDSKQMLDLLRTAGPFEVELRRAMAQETPEVESHVGVEAPVDAAEVAENAESLNCGGCTGGEENKSPVEMLVEASAETDAVAEAQLFVTYAEVEVVEDTNGEGQVNPGGCGFFCGR